MDVTGRLRAEEVLLSGSTLRDANLDLRMTANELVATMQAGEVRAGEVILHRVDGTMQAKSGRGTGTLRAARGTLRVLETTLLTADLDIEGRTLTARNVRGTAYDGALSGDAVLGLDDPAAPRFEFDIRASGVQAGGFLGSVVPFLRQAVSGSFDLQSNWKGTGPTPAVIRSSLVANGEGAASGGRLQALPLLEELGTVLGLPNLRAFDYRDLGFHFAIENGRMAMRDLAIRGTDADLGLDGSIGLDGGLDLALQVKLSEELSRRYVKGKAAGVLGSLFADPNGRLAFDFDVTGPAKKPKLSLDANATAARAGIAALSQPALQRLLGSVPLPPLPIPGLPQSSTPTTPRDAQREAVDALGRKLGGLLRGDKKSTPDTLKIKPQP
jgi:autotransporter translocation and assembly factor TamB